MSIRSMFRLPVLASLMLVAVPLAAQTPADPAPLPAPGPQAPAEAGPTIANATAGYRQPAYDGGEMTWDAHRAKGGSGPVLAIVGGAALLGGLLIGGSAGTAIAVGGLVMGLIGLYLWLK